MTQTEKQHVERMINYAKQREKILAKQKQLTPLTPRELADALISLKKKFPDSFPTNDR